MMYNTFWSSCFLLAMLLLQHADGSLKAQQIDTVRLDSLLQRIEAFDKGMGSLSLFQDGMEVYQKTIGKASLNPDLDAAAQTKYRIGSITKTFTATLILQLAEASKLDLQDKLSKYYPDVKNAEQITIEQLLRHRSGIFNFTQSADYMDWMTHPYTKAQLLAKIEAFDPVFEPGSRMEYSNSNYILLTLIAEQTSGKDYASLLQEHIVQPCGLQHTRLGGKINVQDHEAQSFEKIDGWQLATETDMSIPLGAGAIIGTPTDLNTFLYHLMTGTLISAESLARMQDIQDGMGLGLFQVPFYDKSGYGHNGGIDGFQSIAYYFPTEKLGVAYTANGVVYPVNDIIIGVLSIYFGKDYELPIFYQELELTARQLSTYTGHYTSEQIPLELDLRVKDKKLMLQATGQPEFALFAAAPDLFLLDAVSAEIEFDTSKERFELRQGGMTFTYTRQ